MDLFIGQLVALIAFFAYPAFQYLSLKWIAKKEGTPELWYLPNYGFRLVIRNLPRKKILSNIRYRVLIRTIVPASLGCSVETYQDVLLVEKDDFFLFPGTDQVLISFKLHNDTVFRFVHTDKLGEKIADEELFESSVLIADYAATINNWLNFDIQIAKRVEIKCLELRKAYNLTSASDRERRCDLSRVRNVD